MSIFNDKRIEAMNSGEYFCRECGALMGFEDEWEENLICNNCNHEEELDRYGFNSEEEYEAMYPTLEEVLACEEEKKK